VYNMTYALIAGGIVIFVAGNYSGFYICRTLIEYRKARMAMKHAWPFLYVGAVALIVIVVLSGAYIKAMW
jgi:hypothetical protein